MTATKKICLGAFAGAHGVNGVARIKTFTDNPRDIGAYGPVSTRDGSRAFTLTIVRVAENGVVHVSAPEIQSREDAKALSGTKLFVDRSALPDPDDEDEFYLEDLVGLVAVSEAGARLGVVSGVYDFGAGDVLELKAIPGLKGGRFVPFSKKAIPAVDLVNGRLTIDAAFQPRLEETAEKQAAPSGKEEPPSGADAD